MRWSQMFIPTLKQLPKEAEVASHKLMLRSGLIRRLASGIYSYLPLGLMVLKRIEQIIREEMASCGAQELLLPALQPQQLWEQSGRYQELGEDIISFTDRHRRKMVLGPTHEEVITTLVRNHINSYRQLPLILYQIQTKFRDEVRPRFGVIRSREFIMKDAYSFDLDNQGLEASYAKIYEAYCRIFGRCGLSFVVVEADPGIMGGSLSQEFMVPADNGEDLLSSCGACGYSIGGKVKACPHCKKRMRTSAAIESGHVFKLGIRYSQNLGANYLDKQGRQRPIVMGCYGIGVSRLLASIVEQGNDKDGIVWPLSVAPFEVVVSALDASNSVSFQKAYSVYEKLKKAGLNVLIDDRDKAAGIKLKDADLIGFPIRIVVGQRSLKPQGLIEVRIRRTKEAVNLKEENLVLQVKKLLEELK